MIDTHLHILPGIDDGPETVPEALALARELVQQGVRAAIATPHYNDEFARHSAGEIRERINDLQQELDRYTIPLRLFAGHEALIKPGLVEDVQCGRLATLNESRYLLLELFNNSWIPQTEQVIFELRAHGFVPVIAHPERYRAIQDNPHRLATLLQQGVITQLVAGSLIGLHGNAARDTAEHLLKMGFIHCIASDAHGVNRRPPHLISSLKRAKQLIGQATVSQMIEKWPAAIIHNQEIAAIA